MGIRTALWEKWVEFRDAWLRITLSAVISPLLYLIAFGYGLGGHTGADGHPYIAFLIPGVIALSSMNTGYSAVATPLNVQRLYEHSFEQILISPTPLWQYILGETFGGALRGLYVAVLVLLLSLPFGVEMHVSTRRPPLSASTIREFSCSRFFSRPSLPRLPLPSRGSSALSASLLHTSREC